MLPLLYHAHHSLQAEDIPFWLDLARQYGSPALELGCGTGRVALPLAQAGFRLIGLDHDLAMLAYLQQAAAEANQQLPVFQADMAEFHLDMQFALILLPCNTLSALDDQTRRRVYQQVAAHLSPSGVFVASLPNPHSLVDLPSYGPQEIEHEFIHPTIGEAVQVSSTWRRGKQSFNLTWHYDLLHPDGQVERYSILTKHTLQPLEAYLHEMQGAGLAVQAAWGDFDRSSFETDSPSLTLLAGLESR